MVYRLLSDVPEISEKLSQTSDATSHQKVFGKYMALFRFNQCSNIILMNFKNLFGISIQTRKVENRIAWEFNFSSLSQLDILFAICQMY